MPPSGANAEPGADAVLSSEAASSVQSTPFPITRFYSALVLSNATQILDAGAGRYWVSHSLSGNGLELGSAELRFLREFQAPSTAALAARAASISREDAETMIMQARLKAGWITEAEMAQPAPAEATAQPQA